MASNKLGSLWKNPNPKSENSPRLTGVLKINGEDVRVAVFTNEKRPGKKDPDFNIIESTPMQKKATAPVKKAVAFDDL